MERPLERQVVSIDPLALLLPSNVYVKLIDKFHPHVPKVQDIVTVLKEASPAERKDIAQRTEAIVACTRVVQEAIANCR